MFKLLK